MEDPRSQAARLSRELGPVVYRRCLRLLGDRAAAEDATQEVFVKLLRDMDRLKDRETVLPWVYRVAMNHCLTPYVFVAYVSFADFFHASKKS